MVLSKMPEGILPPYAEITTFFREFKPLDCSCCNQLIGFENRTTGKIICVSDFVGHQRSEYTTSLLTTQWKRNKNEAQVDEKPLDKSAGKTSNIWNNNVVPPLKGEGVKEMVIPTPVKNVVPETRAAAPSPRKQELPEARHVKQDVIEAKKFEERPPTNSPVVKKRDVIETEKFEERPPTNSPVVKKRDVIETEKFEERPSTNSPVVKKRDVIETEKFEERPPTKHDEQQRTEQSRPKPSYDTVDYKALQKDLEEGQIICSSVAKIPSARKNYHSYEIKTDGVNPFFKNLPDQTDPLLEPNKGNTTKKAEETIQIDGQKSFPPLRPSVEIIAATSQTHDPRSLAPTLNKTQPERQDHADQASTAVPETKKVGEEPKIKRFMWQSCKFSKNLVDGATVKATHIWNINKFQLATALDEQGLFGIQDKVNVHLQQVKKLTRPPIIDEMVIGEYNGDYYRGRVTNIKGDMYRVLFVDFGDASEMAYTEMYPVSEYIMKDPIFSVCVVLDGVPRLTRKIKPGRKLKDLVYGKMQMYMIDELVVSDAEQYRAFLILPDERDLNGIVKEVISKLDPDVLASANRI